MNKRSVVVAGIVASSLAAGAVFAGSKYKDHHGFEGRHGGHRLEHMLEKLDDRLDLSAEQFASIKSVLSSNQNLLRQSHSDRMETRLRVMQLDPMSADYDSVLSEVADELAEATKNQTRLYGSMVKQVATVLTPEQRLEARKMIDKRLEKMARRAKKHAS